MYRPLTHETGGPLDKPLKEISTRLEVPAEQVLLAWARAKGTVVVTCVAFLSSRLLAQISTTCNSSSTKKERLEGYLKAGDLGK
jgi:diketogulonate reductase-like aldo/keto reductase